MIPRTFLSTYAVNGQQQMVVAFLDNITGLTRWVDYIPVKLAQGGRENSYDNNGFIDVAVVAKSLTSVPFKDYVPVYADTAATDAWQVNFTGYIPYGYAGSGDASLMLDFTSNFQAFDSRITFTRASSASYFASNGLLTSATTNTPRLDYNPATLAAQGLLIEEQRVNLLTYSDYFDNAAWVKSNATVNANAITSITGNVEADKLVENTAASTTHQATRGVSKTAVATTYTASIFLKAAERAFASIALTDAGGFIVAGFNLSNGASQINSTSGFTGGSVSTTLISNGWYRIVLTATSTADVAINFIVRTATSISVDSYTGDGVSGLYLYGAQLEAGAFATSYAPSVNTFTSRSTTGTFFDSAGVLQSAAINVARNTYNPANLAAQPFLLLEEARTNSIRNNTMVGAVAGTPGTDPTNWAVSTTGSGITKEIIGIGTESGIAYVDIRYSGTPSAGTNVAIAFEQPNQIVASAGQTWSESAYVKLQAGSFANTSTTVSLLATNGVSGTEAFNSSPIASTPTDLKNCRFNVTGTLAAALGTTNVQPRIRIGYTSGVAIDVTIRIGLPQLEQGAYATSVIPTTTTALTRAADLSSSAQATRAADVASVNTLSPWYNASEGTLYAEGTTFDTLTSSFPRPVALSDGTTNNVIQISRNNSSGNARMSVLSGGVNQVAIDATAWPINAISKMALAYATNNFALVSNGGTPATDALGTVPSVTLLRLGIDGPGTSNLLNGYLRRLSYYPRRLSDVELQSLTT